jgi:hypothetical protein
VNFTFKTLTCYENEKYLKNPDNQEGRGFQPNGHLSAHSVNFIVKGVHSVGFHLT